MLMLVIAFYSISYSQTIEVLGNGFFKIDHKFAQQLAKQKDSLKIYKGLYLESTIILQGCIDKMSLTFELMNKNKLQQEKYEYQLQDYRQIIEGKNLQIETLGESRDFLQDVIEKQSKKCKRSKFWQISAGVFGGLVLGFITAISIK